jgi:Helix-turn-helix domain
VGLRGDVSLSHPLYIQVRGARLSPALTPPSFALSSLLGPRGMMTALSRARELLEARLAALEARIRDGDEGAWPDYLTTAAVLASVSAQAVPGSHGELLSTKEMAQRLGISPKTLLKRRNRGGVRPALTLGKRGRAAIRWRGDEVA